jgi:hypothetical protein
MSCSHDNKNEELMTADLQLAPWNTTLSRSSQLRSVTIVDDGELLIALEEPGNTRRYRIRVRFPVYAAYRVTILQFLDKLWELLDQARTEHGPTLIVQNSLWTIKLIETGVFTSEKAPSLIHYLIFTDEELIEILSASPPIIYDFYEDITPTQ